MGQQKSRYRSLYTMPITPALLLHLLRAGFQQDPQGRFHSGVHPPSPLSPPLGISGWTQRRAPALQINRPNLSSIPARWHLGALPWIRRWATQLDSLTRKARPLVEVNKLRNARKGSELQVTEALRPIASEDFRTRAGTQTHRILAHSCRHQYAQRSARGSHPAAATPSGHFCPLRRRRPSPAARTVQPH